MDFKYCPHCGQHLHLKRIGSSQRLYGHRCRQTQYRNPTVGVAVVLIEKDKLLICEKLQHCLESKDLSSWLESCVAKDFSS